METEAGMLMCGWLAGWLFSLLRGDPPVAIHCVAEKPPLDLPFRGVSRSLFPLPLHLFVPVRAGVLVPELRTAQENARLEIGSQRRVAETAARTRWAFWVYIYI